MSNSNLTAERKAELRIEVAKFPNETTQALAIKYGVSTRDIAGAKRSNTCKAKKDEVAEFKANEKKQPKKAIKETNSYHNSEGTNKQMARLLMVKYIKKAGLSLSLPWIECAIEKMLLDLNKDHKFLGVERDADTYKAMRKYIKKNMLPIATHLGNISDKIYGAIPNSYANLILDYCGELVTIADELKYAIANNIMEIDGVMAVTFARPVRSVNKHYGQVLTALGSVISNVNGDERCVSDKAIEAYFHKICGFNYELVEIFNYPWSYSSHNTFYSISRHTKSERYFTIR